MPKKLPLYVSGERNRHDKMVFYFRIGKGQRTRLPDVNHPEFLARYNDAFQANVEGRTKKAGAGSLRWLIEEYRGSSAYKELSKATRRQRDNIFKHVIDKAGTTAFKDISRSSITNGREDRSETPAQARNFLDAMRGLFRWAMDAGHVKKDPTQGVQNPRRPKGAGFAAWTERDVEKYRQKWPRGTKERVWLEVLLYTGLRRGDAVRIGWQHVDRHGFFNIETEKTGTEVYARLLPALREILDEGPVGKETWIVGGKGTALTKESFGNVFRVACNDAGVLGKSAHGVRKIGATWAAEDGATTAELEALFGWTGGTMASHYTKTVNRRRLAKTASEKIMRSKAPHRSKNPRTSKKDSGKSDA